MLADMLALFQAYGAWGLLVLAFTESSFFPIPPDLMLIPLSLAKPDRALWYALLCTAASVSGGYLGYILGRVVGQPLLTRIASEQTIDRVGDLFTRYGVWAVFFAGLTPIPYKVFTISAGLFSMPVPAFILGSVLGRGLRFFLVASLIMFIGEEAVAFISANFNWLTVVVAGGAILLYLLMRRSRRRVPGKWRQKVRAWWEGISGQVGKETWYTTGEWVISVGSGAFLVFFLADIIADVLQQELHRSDVLVSTWLGPRLGEAWVQMGAIINECTLAGVIIVALIYWWKQKQPDRAVFLLVNLAGAAAVLYGFNAVLLGSYQLYGGSDFLPGPFPRLLIDTMWAALVISLAAGGWGQSLRRRWPALALAVGFLLVLSLGRLASGYPLSEVLISFSTAALWAVVVWIVILYRRRRI